MSTTGYHTEILVCESDRFQAIRLHFHRGADGVDAFGDGDGLLGDVDGEEDIVAGHAHAFLPETDLVHITTFVAQVTGVFEESGIAIEAIGDAEDANAGMCAIELDQRLRIDGFLRRGHDADDVAVRHRRMDEKTGGVDMRHHRHQVNRLVVGHFVDLEHIRQTPESVGGIGHTTHDGDGDFFHAHCPVNGIDRADQAGGVARGEFEIILAQTLFVIGIAVEKDIGDLVLLAALEHGLDPGRLIQALFLAPIPPGVASRTMSTSPSRSSNEPVTGMSSSSRRDLAFISTRKRS